MKALLISLWLLSSVAIFSAQNPYDQAHANLAAYFKADIDEKKRVEDARTSALVHAASQLNKGMTRAQLRTVRCNLAQILLRNKANEDILSKMSAITDNHKRTFPFCCKPWVLQSTIDREAKELRERIDETLRKENPGIYNQTKADSSRMFTSPLASVQAYPIVGASAPMLDERLLDQYCQHKK